MLMLVVLMAEYWCLIVDEAFILTIQTEYAKTPEQKQLQEKPESHAPPDNVGRWQRGGSSLPSIWPMDQRDPRLHEDCNVTPIRHQCPLLKADVILIIIAGAITLHVISNVF